MFKKTSACAIGLLFCFFVLGANAQGYQYYMAKCDNTFGNGKFDSALYFAKKTEEAARTGQPGIKSSEYGYIAMTYMGWCYQMQDSLNLAGYWFKKGLQVFDEVSDSTSTNYGESLVNYGNYCNFIGDYSKAEQLFLKAAVLFKDSLEMQDDYGAALNGLGVTYNYKGEYSKAQNIFLDLIQKLGKTIKDTNNIDRATLCFNLSFAYSSAGNPYHAMDYQKKALAIWKKHIVSNRTEYLTSLIELGTIYQAINYQKNGLANWKRGIEAEKAEHITSLIELGTIYSVTGLLDKAEDSYKEAEDNLPDNQHNSEVNAFLLNSEAYLASERNNQALAIKLCSRAIGIMENLGLNNEAYNGMLRSLGEFYIKSKKYEDALAHFKTSVNLIRGVGLEYSAAFQQSYEGLCEALVFLGRDKEASDSLLTLGHLIFDALQKNFPGMSEQDQLAYTKALDTYFDILCTFIYNNKAGSNNLVAEAFKLDLQRKNLVLFNKAHFLGAARNSADSALKALFSSWLSNRGLLSRQYSLNRKQRFLNTDSLENVCEILEKKISTNGGVIPGKNDSAMLSDIFTKAGKNEADIDFITFNHILPGNLTGNTLYAAFVVKNNSSVPAFVPLCSEDQLLGLLKNDKGKFIAPDQLTVKLYTPKSPGANLLYRLIWKPLEASLGTITAVNYTTAGLLNNIAFNAVCSPKGYLITNPNQTLRRFSSLLNVAGIQTRQSPPKEVSLWGNIDYNYVVYTNSGQSSINGKGALVPKHPHIKAETDFPKLDSIKWPPLKQLFVSHNISVTSFENTTASEDDFKKLAIQTSGVLHVYTHGFYKKFDSKGVNSPLPKDFMAANTNPLFRCGLVFAGANNYWSSGVADKSHDDGILTGYEVAELNLQKVQLVTLSACETGLGEVTGSEGNLGLMRAFKIAGVQNVLVSLWPVPNIQTEDLLNFFYQNWLNGQPLHEALKNAEESIWQKNPDPYYWAGFVLVE